MISDERRIEDVEKSDNNNIWDLFERLCFSFGDQDAVQIVSGEEAVTSICYIEIQEYAKALASQLLFRYRPTYVLVDCHGWPGAEIVAILACMRIQVPFVPVSCHNQHAAEGRLETIVKQLLLNQKHGSVVAITCCKDDQDPILGVFQKANVHSIVFVDEAGNMSEALPVPATLPPVVPDKDDLYVLFTSGTSGKTPKGVIGSQRSTLQRIQWFHETFPQLRKVAKRTPLTFVDSIAELLGTLLTPDSVLVSLPGGPESMQLMDIGRLVEITHCNQVSMLPSQLDQLLRYQQSHLDSLASLNRIIISGEPCTESLWNAFRQAYFDNDKNEYRCQLINLYGQTETTGDCCAAVLTSLPSDQVAVDHTITIGAPLTSNISIEGKTTTNDQDLVELVVSGEGCLSNGYLQEPEGGGGFIQGSGSELVVFATGDTGFCQNGLWYVRGRKDDVVKVNGEWISPSAVESVFQDYFRQQTRSGFSPMVVATVRDNRLYLLSEQPENQPNFEFSRKQMREHTRLPWNMIAHKVYSCRSLPRTRGAGKVDRSQAKEIIKRLIHGDSETHSSGESFETIKEIDMKSLLKRFLEVVAGVLSTHSTKIQEAYKVKSFADLGGDSASAVSLQYELRLQWWPVFVRYLSNERSESAVCQIFSLTPLDILNAPVVEDVWESITDQRVHERKHVKRARHERIGSIWPNFSPQPKSTWDELHQSIEFAACVDGRAQVVNTKEEETSILAGCQNGVIQLVCCDKDDLKVLECFHFPDFRLSTNIIDENQIFVCGTRHPKASRLSPGAKLMALSKDLALTHWSIETLATQSIQSSPIVWDNLLWIVSKKDDENHQSIHLYETKDGSSLENDHISLPFSVAANPLLCSSLQIERDDGSMATTVIVYASSDWDTGVVLVDVEKRCLLVNQTDSSNVFFAGEIGPVYKTIVFDSENKSIVISDSWGSIHRIELDTLSISSKKVTNFALSGPCLALDSDIVVGGYDGCVYRLSNDMTTILWSSDVCAVVYSRPLALLETENLIVCTTAGDVCVLDLLTGKGHWKTRLPVGGEIWSDPTEVPARNLETTAGFRQICFGARDSRLHFLKVTINIGTKKDQIC